jgi:hypothetical protein
MSNPQTLSFFRRLLKTGYKVFGEDKVMIDALIIEASRLELKSEHKIRVNRNLTDPVEIQNALFIGEEARDFFETNIIQASSS